MAMRPLTAELRLDGAAMNAVFVETFADLARNLHISLAPFVFEFESNLYVQRCDEPRVVELPDVKVMATEYAGYVSDVVLDVVDVETLRHRLQKDTGGGTAEWESGHEDNDCDDERHERVAVEAPPEVSEPYEERCCYNADVAQRIAHDMEEDAAHVEVVAVTMRSLIFGGLGLCMLMRLMEESRGQRFSSV